MKKPQLIWDIKPVSYILGKDAVNLSSNKLMEFSKIIVLVDDNTEKYCLPVFAELIDNVNIDAVISIAADKNNKTIEQTIDVWSKLSEYNAERDSLLINLGGGVVSDLGGFAAASFKRGINFINYPTSLLGMVDAGIGGKTGLDFGGIKNQVGLFVNPKCVIIDPVFLKTLDDKQLQSGFAELLKCALIMDKDLWETLKHNRYDKIEDWDSLIVQSARNKVDIVRHDAFEKGLRKILNFGHTVGHAIESFYFKNDIAITHGEAVAAGMICELYISAKLYDIEDEIVDEIIDVIDANFERFDFEIANIGEILQLMKQDKKNKNGANNFSLIRRLGKAVHDITVEEDLIKKSLKFYLMTKTGKSE